MHWIAPTEKDAATTTLEKRARELLARLKALLVLNWRQKASARSQLKLTIEDTLDTGLPRPYTPDLYRQKCSALFEHVYESYAERNAGGVRLRLWRTWLTSIDRFAGPAIQSSRES